MKFTVLVLCVAVTGCGAMAQPSIKRLVEKPFGANEAMLKKNIAECEYEVRRSGQTTTAYSASARNFGVAMANDIHNERQLGLLCMKSKGWEFEFN